MKDTEGTIKIGSFRSFRIGDEASGYQLSISDFDTTDDFYIQDSLSVHDGHKFTTKDNDNDNDGDRNCAVLLNGAGWWVSLPDETSPSRDASNAVLGLDNAIPQLISSGGT